MKLRFHGNSLRLRLSQSEVARLAETGKVEETITFAPEVNLSYSIETRPSGAVAATLEGSHIRVLLPADLSKTWIESGQTGIEGGTESLRVLIEKDFQCLHHGSDDADAFPNPQNP
jgi:hypothetical protein